MVLKQSNAIIGNPQPLNVRLLLEENDGLKIHKAPEFSSTAISTFVAHGTLDSDLSSEESKNCCVCLERPKNMVFKN